MMAEEHQPRYCTAPDCSRPYFANRYCKLHNNRHRRGAEINAPIVRPTKPLHPCSVEGCDRPSHCKTYCYMHYYRNRKGQPMTPGYLPRRTGPRPGTGLGGCRNPNYNGTEISYAGAHARPKSLWGSASQYECVDCGKSAQQWAYDGTDPSHKLDIHKSGNSLVWFSVWPEFYMPLCVRCHRFRDDGRAKSELRAFRRLKHAGVIDHLLEDGALYG